MDLDLAVGGRMLRVEGKRYLVPRHIQRIDSDPHYMHGWQVRLYASRRGTTKFYSDDKCHGVANALEAARITLRLHLGFHPKPKRFTRASEQRGKLRIGITGARLLWVADRRSAIRDCLYAMIYVPTSVRNRWRSVNLYIGKPSTLTDQRIGRALGLMRAARKHILIAMRDGTPEQLQWLNGRTLKTLTPLPAHPRRKPITVERCKTELAGFYLYHGQSRSVQSK